MTARSLGLKGGPELLDFLEAFPEKLKNGALRAGMTAAAKPIRDQARANVRKRSGKLAKAIRSGSPRVNKDGTVSVRVYAEKKKGGHGFLAHIIEYGAAPHFITPGDSDKSARVITRAAGAGRVTGDVTTGVLKLGNNIISGAVFHPGHAAFPFMRPALDARAEDAVKAFADRVRSYLKDRTAFSAPAVELDQAA